MTENKAEKEFDRVALAEDSLDFLIHLLDEICIIRSESRIGSIIEYGIVDPKYFEAMRDGEFVFKKDGGCEFKTFEGETLKKAFPTNWKAIVENIHARAMLHQTQARLVNLTRDRDAYAQKILEIDIDVELCKAEINKKRKLD